MLSKSKNEGSRAFNPLRGIIGEFSEDLWVLSLVSFRATKVIPLSAESLVKSCLSLSVKSWIIFEISSGVRILLQTLTRSAAAIMLRVFTSWSMSILPSLTKIAL